MADIAVTPTEATQGDSARLTLRIPEERPSSHTMKVELYLPESTPIAEVYPMSVPDWAPGLTMRRLAEPTALIHGTETTEVVSSVTWTRVTEPGSGSGDVAELSVSLGPLPAVDRMVFAVLQTYADGTVVRWGSVPGGDAAVASSPAPEIRLLPPAGGAAAQGETDNAGAGAQSGPVDHSAPDSVEDPGTGVGVGLSVAMVLVLVAGGAILMYPRRRPTPLLPSDPPADTARSEPSAPLIRTGG
ncbi:MAG TPA: DUF1775 domain-containing protein [Micromonosporaceae bacterium]|nr:DUF1775 domain-containing protein [Micromonosporaceae bacterium]